MTKKYNIIYSDPPWPVNGAKKHYPVMSIPEICALPVAEIAAPDCVLFLWVTYTILPRAFDVLKAWGFKYRTVAFTWVKRNKKSQGYFFGMGNWTRANAEICLLTTRGKPKRVNNAVRQIIDTPVEAHSKKPDVARERIVALMGGLPRVELFARQTTPGWDVWGNEVESANLGPTWPEA